jgi:hypothetical protein
MPVPFKSMIGVSVAALFSILAASCSANKLSQCRALIEIANQAANEIQQVTTTTSTDISNPEDLRSMLRVAETADNRSTEMRNLGLRDEQLNGYRNRFVDMYSAISESTRNLVTAVEQQNRQEAEQAYNALLTAINQEQDLVDDVNTYCTE